MQQVLTDLWQTRTDSPFPGLTTHAFLWTGRRFRRARGISDADALATSLRLLRTLVPDVVISSAFHGDSAVTHILPEHSTDHVDEALDGLTAARRRTRYV